MIIFSETPQKKPRGRPKLYDEPANARLVVLLTASQKDAIQRIAESEQRDVAKVVRDAIDSYVGDFMEDGAVFQPVPAPLANDQSLRPKLGS